MQTIPLPTVPLPTRTLVPESMFPHLLSGTLLRAMSQSCCEIAVHSSLSSSAVPTPPSTHKHSFKALGAGQTT